MPQLSFGKASDKNMQLVLQHCSKKSWKAMLHVLPPTWPKKCNIAIQLILQQFYKTSCMFFFVAQFIIPLVTCVLLLDEEGPRDLSVRYNKVSLYRGSLSYILLLLDEKYRLFYRGLRYIEVRYIEAHRGLTVTGFEPGRAIAPIPHCKLNCPFKKRPRGQLVPFKI